MELQEAANADDQSTSFSPVHYGMSATAAAGAISSSHAASTYSGGSTLKDNRYDNTQGGRIQLQLWSREKNTILVVSILAADYLPQREDYHFGGHLPEAYVRIRLLPSM